MRLSNLVNIIYKTIACADRFVNIAYGVVRTVKWISLMRFGSIYLQLHGLYKNRGFHRDVGTSHFLLTVLVRTKWESLITILNFTVLSNIHETYCMYNYILYIRLSTKTTLDGCPLIQVNKKQCISHWNWSRWSGSRRRWLQHCPSR